VLHEAFVFQASLFTGESLAATQDIGHLHAMLFNRDRASSPPQSQAFANAPKGTMKARD